MRAIDADAMIDRLKEWDTKDKTDKALYNFTLNRINEQPTIQPKRGKWIDIDSETYTWKIRCDKCGHERSMMSTQGKYPNFCEECGAYMREKTYGHN